ncbi:hypothetical protein [Hahella ganghwensis]|uniref:hypothetical protein n=1 Tax=Hahella ganghwensis TaxID=286420 RepID=UPI00039E280A|nr:hypothetical protein [Hahella ganghwensis]
MEALIEAYRSKDIEAAVEAKGFREEAKQMLRDLDVSIEHDPEQVALTAEVLELSYRRKIEEYGFPDFSGAVCEVGLLRHYQNNIYIATEDCESESGYASYFNIYVAETKYGWRVLNSAPRK